MSELWDCCVCQSWWMWDLNWHVPHRSSAQRQTIWNIEQGLPVFSCSRVNSGFQLICSRVQTMGGGRWRPMMSFWWISLKTNSVGRAPPAEISCQGKLCVRSHGVVCSDWILLMPFHLLFGSAWFESCVLDYFFLQAPKMGNSCNLTIFQMISSLSHFSNNICCTTSCGM